MEWIAAELSPKVHISLMSQYYPTACVSGHPVLGRKISAGEYQLVLHAMERLGFYNGWIQEHESSTSYRPDFDKIKPFE
jgi:putative pyruvate formate lyase activating enzyme